MFKEIFFRNLSQEQKDIIIAFLNEMKYFGFEEVDDGLKAYILPGEFNEKELHAFSKQYHLSFGISEIENKNWNELWESNFQPVLIDDFVFIRADFHSPAKNSLHEIIITPKMSFGTGHHATTSMMIKMMKEINFTNKTVLDFGTGTGVLAILAEKMGASKVVAIDNDDWSIENATENFLVNGCQKIELIKNSTAFAEEKIDIVLANILKSVLIENLSSFKSMLSENGHLIMSGLLKNEEAEISTVAANHNFTKMKTLSENEWICLRFDVNK